MHYTLPIYVPQSTGRGLDRIDRGSAIVGGRLDAPAGMLWVDYEDGRGADRARTFADRAHLAAWRHLFGSPGDPRLLVASGDVVRVGRYDGLMSRVSIAGVDEEESLARWLDARAMDPSELRITVPSWI